MNCYQNVYMETHKMLTRHLMDLFGLVYQKEFLFLSQHWKWERIDEMQVIR